MSRTVSDDLKAHFGQDVTTIAMCWRIARTDGEVLGFTSHDAEIAYDGVTYSPFTAADVSALEQTGDGAPDNVDITVAFDSAAIIQSDLVNGVYDNADLYVFLINYADTSQGIVRLVCGELGPVELRDYGGKVEFKSLTDKLSQKIGRAYAPLCDADLGDDRCTVVLSGYGVSGTVSGVTDRGEFTDTGRTEDAGYFTYGRLVWDAGANAGREMEVKRFYYDGASAGTFALFNPMPENIADGDTYTVYPGCDKAAGTCKSKFSNLVNFRGFPHLPGRDRVVQYPSLPK